MKKFVSLHQKFKFIQGKLLLLQQHVKQLSIVNLRRVVVKGMFITLLLCYSNALSVRLVHAKLTKQRSIRTYDFLRFY